MLKRIGTCFLVFLFIAGSLLASVGPVEADFSGFEINSKVEVSLSLPYPVMLRDEKPMVIVGIKNNSDKELPLVEDMGWFSTSMRDFNQLFFEVQRKTGNDIADGEMGYKPWSMMLQMEPFLRRSLKPGDALLASTPEINLVGDWRHLDATKVRCILLVGENQIATSNWEPVEFLEKSISDHVSVEKIDYGSESGNLAKMFVCDIQGTRWVFDGNRRVAMVPEGATPSYEADLETGVVTIHFKGSTAEPVKHSIRKARTLSGPRELVPHLYVSIPVEAQGAEANGPGQSNDERTDQAVESSDPSPESAFPKWRWLCIGVLVVIVLLIILRSSKS